MWLRAVFQGLRLEGVGPYAVRSTGACIPELEPLNIPHEVRECGDRVCENAKRKCVSRVMTRTNTELEGSQEFTLPGSSLKV